MLRKRWIWATLVLTIIMAILTGVLLKKDYKQLYSSVIMNESNVTNLCLVCTLDEFSYNKELYYSMMDNPSIILKVKLIEKYKLSDSILSKVEVLEDYVSSGLSKNEYIYILEDYEINEVDNNYEETNYSLEIPLYSNREYIVNLKKSEFSKEIYEFKMDVFSKVQITTETELRYINDDLVLNEADKINSLQFNLVDLNKNRFVTDALEIEDPVKFAIEYNELHNKIMKQLLEYDK